MSHNSISITVKQTVAVSQNMLQFLSVLQMDAMELEEHINRQANENPAIEIVPPSNAEEAAAFHPGRRAGTGPSARENDDGSASLMELVRTKDEYDTLSFFLRHQVSQRGLDKKTRAVSEYLCSRLDEEGYLPQAVWRRLKEESGLPLQDLRRALKELQSLEPAGIGARSLRECLALQLHRIGGGQSVACEIVRTHLDALAGRRFGQIAKALGCSMAEVRTAAQTIARLDPAPGRTFCADEAPAYIWPDVILEETQGIMNIRLNEYHGSHIQVSDYYNNLLKHTDDADVQAYLKGKIAQARWLKGCIEQREQTLKKCIGSIVDCQKGFFTEACEPIRPMTLRTISAATGLHESTVCRAVKGKYLQCRRGTFPLQIFFSKRISAQEGAACGDFSAHQVKRLLAGLIEKEDKAAPLSDQKLVELLLEQQIAVSRRTIAKYREELHIMNTHARRIMR